MHRTTQNMEETEQLIRTHADMVYRLAYSYVRNRSDAEDIFQETFLRYVKAKPEFESEAHCKAWLIRVTANCAKNYLNSAWKWHTVSYEEAVNVTIPEEERRLDAALRELPAQYRAVIHLYYYEGYRTEEIANGVRWEGALDMIDWKTAEAAFCEKSEMYLYGSSTEAGWEHLDSAAMVRPSVSETLPSESVKFTGAGYQDGLLHVQVYMEDLKLNQDGTVWLEKPDGTQVYSVAELHGCADKADLNDLTACYKEFLFDVNKEDLEEYTLHGRFGQFTDMVEGDWSVTFTLPEEE